MISLEPLCKSCKKVSPHSFLKNNDIVITTKCSQIKTVMIDNLKDNVICSSNLIIIHVHKQQYNPSFLYEYLKSPSGQLLLNSIQTRTTVKVLSIGQLKEMEVPCIDIETGNALGKDIEMARKNYKDSLEHIKMEFNNNKKNFVLTYNGDN